jgi:hypothetical protein
LFGFLKSLFKANPVVTELKAESGSKSRRKRSSRGSVFDAYSSGDLEIMLDALPVRARKVDRHFLLMSIVEATHQRRDDVAMRVLCCEIADLHLREFPSMVRTLKGEGNEPLPHVSTFRLYADVLTEMGRYSRAIEVCEMAMRFDQDDGTRGGFPGRIEDIRWHASRHPEASASSERN